MDSVWKERAKAAAERGWQVMSHLLAQVSRLVTAEPALPGSQPILTTRGVKRAAERTLRIAETLARRLFCALALELADEAIPDTKPLHGERSRTTKGRSTAPRRHTFPLFEYVARIEDCISDFPPPERPDRPTFDRLPDETPVSAHSLAARADALRSAISNPEAMARRLLARLERGRHAGKLTNLAPGWPPGLPRKAEDVDREQITWVSQTVSSWATERHWAKLAPG